MAGGGVFGGTYDEKLKIAEPLTAGEKMDILPIFFYAEKQEKNTVAV